MAKHTRGSWWHGGAGCCVKRRETEDDHGEILPERHIACTWGEDANGWKPDIYSREDEANAARIAACVNALDGIEDPEAFVWRAATNEQLVPVLLEALRGMIGAYSGHGVGGVAEEQSADESIAALETAIALVRSSQKALDLGHRREVD